MHAKKKSPIATTLGDNIKRIRLANGFNVKELASKMRVTVQSWYKWERGEVIPEEENQLKIAATMGVALNDVRRGIGDEGQESENDQRSGDEMDKRIRVVPDIPVIGLVSCSTVGWYQPKPLAVRAPTIPDDVNPERLFAVLAVGTSMIPDGIREGYLLYCDTMAKPEKGDAVYVKTKDGNVSVKRLASIDENWLVLHGWLDPDKNGNQKPFKTKISREFVDMIACVVLIRRKA